MPIAKHDRAIKLHAFCTTDEWLARWAEEGGTGGE